MIRILCLVGFVWAIRIQAQAQRILHTYYDANKEENEDNHNSNLLLLQYWQKSWQAAGWETVILNASHIKNDSAVVMPYAPSVQHQGQHSSLHKWMAMATRGGYYCHWDVFPLTNRRHDPDQSQNAFYPFNIHSTSNSSLLLLPDTLVVYEVIAPTCMSGSRQAWQQMTHALYEHARNETHFWTDALALVDLRERVSFQRGVLQLDDSLLFAVSSKQQHVQQHDPCHNLQKHVQRKRKWAVQFSPATLQRARYMPADRKHPQHRLDVAQSWFQDYHGKCRF